MTKITLGSLFAGIGGIDLGFQNAGVSVIWANEINKFCGETYRANHHTSELIIGDVDEIQVSEIPDINILTAGFPCQAFSVAGYRKGFDDERGILFFQILRILSELKTENRLPDVVFLENVKNLFTHNKGETYKFMKNELEKIGYNVVEKILNTQHYGNIPQNRERLYIVCFKNIKHKKAFKFPEKIEMTKKLEDVIAFNEIVSDKYYYTESSICYPLLSANMKNNKSIYQYRRVYVRENKSKVSPTLTANMGTGGHNVPIIMDSKGNIRKLTPRECLSLQGFPPDFIIPQHLPDSKVYQQAGNSVTVTVIQRLAEAIIIAMRRGK
jgi:DNA (cytosine-5)-methyltransferase 1